jgi:hypothetical protein
MVGSNSVLSRKQAVGSSAFLADNAKVPVALSDLGRMYVRMYVCTYLINFPRLAVGVGNSPVTGQPGPRQAICLSFSFLREARQSDFFWREAC